MICLNCKYSEFENDENGVVELVCLKFKKNVLATTSCINSAKFRKEERAKKIYLDNYQQFPLREVARMIGWSIGKLNWFIYINFLPRVHIRKRKVIK